MSTNRKIASASIILIIASSLGAIISLAKEMLVAKQFGISVSMDAYSAATAIPAIINNIILATFGAVFIPVFIKYQRKDSEEAYYIASVVSNYLVLFLVLTSLLIGLCAPLIMRYGFYGLPAGTLTLSVHILRVLCVMIVLGGMVGMASGILNAQGYFSAPAFSNMLITASTIWCILFLSGTAGVLALAYGMIAGLVLQLCVLLPVLRRRGYRHSLSFDVGHPAMKELLMLSLVFFWAIIAAQINMLVDKMMASYLASGSIAAFGYAEKIIQVPIMIFTASLATAVFPFFAAQVAESRIEELKDSLAKSIQMSGLIFLPITAGLVALAAPIVQLILQRGAFDRTAAEVTSLIVVCFSFQLFSYSTVNMLVRVFLAFQEIATLVKVVMGGMVLNIVLNLAFIKLVKPPVAGIALSTSCVYLIMACVFFVILRMRIGALHGKEMLISVAKIAVLSAVMGGVMYSMHGLFLRLFPHPMVMGQVLALCAAGASGCLIFLAGGYFINVRELRSLARFVTPWVRSSS